MKRVVRLKVVYDNGISEELSEEDNINIKDAGITGDCLHVTYENRLGDEVVTSYPLYNVHKIIRNYEQE